MKKVVGIFMIITFWTVRLNEAGAQQLVFSKKPITYEKRYVDQAKVFSAEDPIHALFTVKSSFNDFLGGLSTLRFVFEIDATKDTAVIGFTFSPPHLKNKAYVFTVVSEEADLTVENEYRFFRLVGTLPQGIHKINVYYWGLNTLATTFFLDFSKGPGRYKLIYNEQILPLVQR